MSPALHSSGIHLTPNPFPPHLALPKSKALIAHIAYRKKFVYTTNFENTLQGVSVVPTGKGDYKITAVGVRNKHTHTHTQTHTHTHRHTHTHTLLESGLCPEFDVTAILGRGEPLQVFLVDCKATSFLAKNHQLAPSSTDSLSEVPKFLVKPLM